MQWIALLAFKPDSYHIIVRIVVDTSIQDVKQWMLSLSLGGGVRTTGFFCTPYLVPRVLQHMSVGEE